MMDMSMMSPEKVAMEYGGNKQKIAAAVQSGLLNPTVAVMAGMFIDRMRAGAAEEQAGNTTVAQDILAAQGLGATPEAQQLAQGQERAMAAMPPAAAGLAALPVDESMVPGGEGYAGGGIVAFNGEDGSFVDGMFTLTPAEMGPMSRADLVEMLSLPELQEYNRSGKLPERLRPKLEGRPISGIPQLGKAAFTTSMPQFATPPAPAAAPAAPAEKEPPAPPKAKKAPVAAPAAPAQEARKEIVPPAAAAELPDEAKPKSMKDWKAAQREFGIAEDPMADVRAKIASMAGESQANREFAKNMALAQAGFSMAAGKSPYALQNIGAGAMAGVERYGKDIKDIKEAEKDLFKMQTELARADDARVRGDFKSFQEHNENARKYAMDLKKLGFQEEELGIKREGLEVQRDVAAAQKAYYNRPGAAAEQLAAYKSDPAAFAAMMSARGGVNAERLPLEAMSKADAALAKDIEYFRLASSKKPEDRIKAAEMRRNKIAEYMAAAGASVPGVAGGGADPLGLRGGR